MLDRQARAPLRTAAEGERYASPTQVAAADALLSTAPFGPIGLFEGIDPNAAAVAAAHWLCAAADVTARVAGCAPTRVVLEADDIESLEVETSTHVLERLNDGRSPREAVLDLIGARRPARELLDDLLNGIWGCYLLFSEYAEFDDDEEDEAWSGREKLFLDRVRIEAGNTRKRLF